VAESARGASWGRPDWPLADGGELAEAPGEWAEAGRAISGKVKAQAQTKGVALSAVDVERATSDSLRALMLIRAYRARGHFHANLDPLHLTPPHNEEELDPRTYGFTESDLDRPIFLDHVLGLEFGTLREIIAILRRTYCQTLGVEFLHISDGAQKGWIQERIEGPDKEITFTREGKRAILNKLVEAEGFEKFCDVKFTGTKRFGLDGAESMIPALEQIIKRGGALGVREIVIGMSHRGRLNVLAQVMGKPHRAIFHEFKGGSSTPNEVEGSGDVKYHLGASSDREFDSNTVHLSLTANPSHLEIVDPVVLGKVRAKQDQHHCTPEDRTCVMPLLIHGDAAFAGQGVVAETLQLSQLRGYRTGGTVHVIINNQVGFTTAPESSRSSDYCTDVAKTVQAHIFHVNGDDPEAACWVARLAVDYRRTFGRDVVIDMICYRRRGHNEGDDPSMTNPLMYQIVDTKRSVRRLYTEALIGRGDITPDEAEEALRDYRQQLDQVFTDVRALEKAAPAPSPSVELRQVLNVGTETAVDEATLRRIADAALQPPAGFTTHPRVLTLLQRRADTIRDGGIDWGFAELLALGSIAMNGRMVRLTGQDSRRGTFAQRHSVLVDQHTGTDYQPLQHLSDNQGRVLIYDSALTEYAALGFEYGYSVANRDALVLWEAQFGDFVNGAQSVIDEYLSSGEAKWGQQSGVVLLLPHGHEGQGPDHTSGRIERFLLLCAEGSMTVAVPSTPANYFHLLRRHALDTVHRPMIVFTPKSMLRNKASVSAVTDFTTGRFQPVIDDPTVNPEQVSTVLFTSGKFYYELDAYRRSTGNTTTAIVRVEKLYPVPHRSLGATLSRYPNAIDLRWVQEEPGNQGAWPFFGLALPELDTRFTGIKRISRRAMAAPSAGSTRVHDVEQAAVVAAAFA